MPKKHELSELIYAVLLLTALPIGAGFIVGVFYGVTVRFYRLIVGG